MKIGIMTYWGTHDNYGQVLQCYALIKLLNDNGHEAFLIRYNRHQDIRKSSKLTLIKRYASISGIKSLLKRCINKHHSKKESFADFRKFKDFYDLYIPSTTYIYNSLIELQKNPPKADVYISGSDQIWNFWNLPLKQYRNPIHAYFLDFGDKSIKRISVASSWGVNNLPKEYVEEISSLIQNYDYVSVREKNGLDLCRLCGVEKPEWIVDPTLFLSKTMYKELFKNYSSPKINSKFLFVYILNLSFSTDIDSIYDFASRKNLEVILVTGNDLVINKKRSFATMQDWLWYIENAEYVLTNSFHGTVFSLIFQKKVGILKNKMKTFDSRFDSLFEILGLKNDRYIFENDFTILDKEPECISDVSYFREKVLKEVCL